MIKYVFRNMGVDFGKAVQLKMPMARSLNVGTQVFEMPPLQCPNKGLASSG